MSDRQKRLFELQQKLKASRKANQTAVMAERRRQQAPDGSDKASEKRKWFEEKQKRKEAELERLGLDKKDVSGPGAHGRPEADHAIPWARRSVQCASPSAV